MSHTVLARKWRPKKFADLVGQQNTVTILQNIIASGRLHHAYLLTGTRGVGKTTIARIIAKALNCLTPQQNEPCGKCNNCLQIDIGRYVDVIEIDAASNTGVDNIREVLENAQYAPTSGKYKIYIIDEVHMLSKSAFNAMLKTLEEPPEHVVFILATTDPQKVPITVLSRCLQLKLRNLSAGEIESHLANILNAEGYQFENEAAALLSSAANGSMRDALSLTDQAIAFTKDKITANIVQQMLGISDDKNILAILNAIVDRDSNLVVQICQSLNNDGANLENILEQINNALFQIGLIQLSVQPNAKEEYISLAKIISLQDCQLYFEISNLGLEQIRKVNHKYPILTMSLLRMLAFTIGSNEQKQIIIQSNNCHTEVITEQQTVKSQDDISTKNSVDNVNTKLETSSTPKTLESKPQNIETISTEPNQPIINTPEINPITGSDPENFISWLDFVKHIDLTTIDKQIAVILNNASQIGSLQNDVIKLQISDSYCALVNAECVDEIERILFNKYQTHFDLSFDFTHEEVNETRKSHDKDLESKKQSNAEDAIYNDPIIQDLVNNFSAKILPNSIKPL